MTKLEINIEYAKKNAKKDESYSEDKRERISERMD